MKISEGCDHGCAFCAIPLMRGKHRSFALDEVVQEAQLLELQGAREINLVAQDLAHYGRDRRDGVNLPELLESLVAEHRYRGYGCSTLFRRHHRPPARCRGSRESRAAVSRHAHSARLRSGTRTHAPPRRKRTIRERVQKFVMRFPMSRYARRAFVGFPGETDEQFEELLQFLEEMQFEGVGAFTYSAQEGTRAVQ